MNIGLIGVAGALALAACGSAIGVGTAGMASVGAWKKCFAANKPAPFTLMVFVGAPLTQTIYGFILMNRLISAVSSMDPGLLLGAGLLGGLAMGFSAWFQGKAGASGADAFADTGKGFVNYVLVIGLVETTALFVMVFLLGVVS
jgi:V/A-type H+-transporting ATPase subunit K